MIVTGGGFLLPSSRVPGEGWFCMKLIPAQVMWAMSSYMCYTSKDLFGYLISSCNFRDELTKLRESDDAVRYLG